MLANTRRRRVIHPFLWILGLIITITLVLAIALPAHGCEPHHPDCQLETPEALADSGSALVIWLIITAASAVVGGAIMLLLVRRYP